MATRASDPRLPGALVARLATAREATWRGHRTGLHEPPRRSRAGRRRCSYPWYSPVRDGSSPLRLGHRRLAAGPPAPRSSTRPSLDVDSTPSGVPHELTLSGETLRAPPHGTRDSRARDIARPSNTGGLRPAGSAPGTLARSPLRPGARAGHTRRRPGACQAGSSHPGRPAWGRGTALPLNAASVARLGALPARPRWGGALASRGPGGPLLGGLSAAAVQRRSLRSRRRSEPPDLLQSVGWDIRCPEDRRNHLGALGLASRALPQTFHPSKTWAKWPEGARSP